MALWVESLAFGAFTVLYAIAIWILLYKDRKRSSATPNRRLFATSTVMWLLAVAVRPSLLSHACERTRERERAPD